MNDINMTEELANKVYDVLSSVCGATDTYREVVSGPDKGQKYNPERSSFVCEFAYSKNPTSEWRFQGKLGFGGKFWWNADRFYVSYYSEDETAERIEIKNKADEILSKLYLEL